jgi:hypothetical protein
MRHYASSTTIDAPPEKVWEVLVDGAHYPDWDSGVLRVEGTTGPMVALIWRSMPDLQPSFDQFVRGIKQRLEHLAAL